MKEKYEKLQEWLKLHEVWALKLSGFAATPLRLEVVPGDAVIGPDDAAPVVRGAMQLPQAHAAAMEKIRAAGQPVPYELAMPVWRAVASHFAASPDFRPRHGTEKDARDSVRGDLTYMLRDIATGYLVPLDAQPRPDVQRHIAELVEKAGRIYGATVPMPYVLITKNVNVSRANPYLPYITVPAGTDVRSRFVRAHEFAHFTRFHIEGGTDAAYAHPCHWRMEEGKADALAMMLISPREAQVLTSENHIRWLNSMRGIFYPKMEQFVQMAQTVMGGNFPSIRYSPEEKGCQIEAIVPHRTPQEAVRAR